MVLKIISPQVNISLTYCYSPHKTDTLHASMIKASPKATRLHAFADSLARIPKASQIGTVICRISSSRLERPGAVYGVSHFPPATLHHTPYSRRGVWCSALPSRHDTPIHHTPGAVYGVVHFPPGTIHPYNIPHTRCLMHYI